LLDEIFTEPFPGFEPAAIEFLKKLRIDNNNNKAWFDKHRKIYEEEIKMPVRLLIDDLAIKLKKLDPDIAVSYRSIFRINRDIRFAKDKRPYNTHISAGFCFHDTRKDINPSFYIVFNADRFQFDAGMYCADRDRINKIKKRILKEPEEYRSIISKPKFKKNFKKVIGKVSEKMPKEFSGIDVSGADKLVRGSLLMNQFYIEKIYPVKVVYDSSLPDIIIEDCKTAYDFVKFLDEAIRKG
jgi:uncharacterized protein (TIGR02453 family)